MKKLVVEFVGTFFLVLTVGLTAVYASAEVAQFAPIAIGVALAVMIYAGGHISGGHYNPAVSLGVLLRGGIKVGSLVGYWIAQLAGAVAAACVAAWLKGNPAVTSLGVVTAPALVSEFLFTFALVFVVLNVATAKATAGNSYFGWAIGLTVLVGAFAVGGISGGAFNPAVAVGLVSIKKLALSNLWIYLVGDFAGAIAAAAVFKLTVGENA
ncbi:MAG: aquaporin [Kiritimatiellae bacterium]|nr:aquaporin [Kiritimatiellia bacterium]MCO5069226.1 aquaporin [Kiritimatiellia bacterium]